jgi:hypothetical protein
MSEIKDYNDTISAIIAKACLKAYENYDKEKERGESHRVAMARAIGDAIRDNIKIYNVESRVDRSSADMLRKEKGYAEYQDRQCFSMLNEEIFKSENFRKVTFDLGYEIVIKYQVALFSLERGE